MERLLLMVLSFGSWPPSRFWGDFGWNQDHKIGDREMHPSFQGGAQRPAEDAGSQIWVQVPGTRKGQLLANPHYPGPHGGQTITSV